MLVPGLHSMNNNHIFQIIIAWFCLSANANLYQLMNDYAFATPGHVVALSLCFSCMLAYM